MGLSFSGFLTYSGLLLGVGRNEYSSSVKYVIDYIGFIRTLKVGT